jgi:hypothetical protein
MSKRLVVKLAVTVAALGAMTLVQGCYEEEDGMVVSFAWSPINFVPAARFGFAPNQGAMAGGVQGGGGGAATGGVTAAGAAAAGGGGNQVSGYGF